MFEIRTPFVANAPKPVLHQRGYPTDSRPTSILTSRPTVSRLVLGLGTATVTSFGLIQQAG